MGLFNLINGVAVSYTHLDVYKRQFFPSYYCGCFGGNRCYFADSPFNWCGYNSGTHSHLTTSHWGSGLGASIDFLELSLGLDLSIKPSPFLYYSRWRSDECRIFL